MDFVKDYCSNMFQITQYIIVYVCILLNCWCCLWNLDEIGKICF